MKKKAYKKKHIITYVKDTLDTILKLEANSASCTVFYEPKSPKELSKFKIKFR